MMIQGGMESWAMPSAVTLREDRLRSAINQAARDRASLTRSDSQASISLRIADNLGSVARKSSANSLVFSASTVAFNASII
jgi:hypothetical protein